MSLNVLIYLPPERMPTPLVWQKAIMERGFQVVIDTDFDPFSDTGFRPGEYKGEPGGFEFFARTLTAEECGRAGVPQELCLCVDLITQGGPEWHCSIIAGAVFAELTEGIFDQTDAYDGRWRGEDAVYYARKLETWEEDHQEDDLDDMEEDYGGRTPLNRPK